MYNPIQSSGTTFQDNIDVPEPNNILPFDIDADEIDGVCDNDNDDDGSWSREDLVISNRVLERSQLWLYLSHFFALFSEDYWQFSVVLFLSAISNFQSILYISTFGLSLNVGSLFATPWIGSWIDRRPAGHKLGVTQLVLAAKHVTIIMLAVLSWMILRIALPLPQPGEDNTTSSDSNVESIPIGGMFVIFAIIVFGTVARVLDQTFNNIIIERDVVVVLSECAGGTEQSQTKWLSKTNAALERISLVAKIVVGFLVFEENYQLTCLCIGIVATIAWIVQYICIARIFQLVPALEHLKDDGLPYVDNMDAVGTLDVERDFNLEDDEQEDIAVPKNRWSISIYLEQSFVPAGISLALLYSNCVTFGNGMLSSYLLNRKIHVRTIGVLRGISSGVGLLGTFGYTLMLRFCSLETTGLWGVAWQALSLGLASIFLSVNHSKDTLTNDIFLQLFIILVISSRLGLWIFGISVIQLQQQETPEKYRCLVGGVQESLNALLNMIANGIGLIFTHPDDFVYISTSGFISVTLAFFFFFLGIFLPRRNATRELQTCNNGKN